MTAPNVVIIAAATLVAIALLAFAALRGWHDWLTLKHRELDRAPREIEGGVGSGAARIEIADLKERIRRLEAIAAGVDL